MFVGKNSFIAEIKSISSSKGAFAISSVVLNSVRIASAVALNLLETGLSSPLRRANSLNLRKTLLRT